MNRYGISKTKEIISLVIISLTLALCITITVTTMILASRVSDTKRLIDEHECSVQLEYRTHDTTLSEVVAEKERLYVLGVKDDRLTVFGSDGVSVIDTLDTYIYSLPLSDREAISEGIPVYSINELVGLIEDFTS